MIHMAISILSGNVIIKHQTQVVESRGNSLRSWFSSPSRDPPHALLALGATSSWASGGTPVSFVGLGRKEGQWFCKNSRIHQKHGLLREMNYTPVQQVCIYSPCVLECQQLVHWWLQSNLTQYWPLDAPDLLNSSKNNKSKIHKRQIEIWQDLSSFKVLFSVSPSRGVEAFCAATRAAAAGLGCCGRGQTPFSPTRRPPSPSA